MTDKNEQRESEQTYEAEYTAAFQALIEEGLLKDLGDMWELKVEDPLDNVTQLDPAHIYFPKVYTNPQVREIGSRDNFGNYSSYARMVSKYCFAAKGMKRSRGIAMDYVDRLSPDDFMNCMSVVEQVLSHSLKKYIRRTISQTI